MSAVIELTKSLINIASISPEDNGCMQLLIPRLGKMGFDTELLPCQSTQNLWARYGDSSPLLCFVGHTDVVPAGDEQQWQYPPFQATEDNGYLYGRGAADMKSGLAAMIVALERYYALHDKFPCSIALLITSAEEEFSETGTPTVIHTLQQRGEQIDYCIVGEPSSTKEVADTIKNGRRGTLDGKLTVHGTQGHIAYPQFADNPIHHTLLKLHDWLNYQWDQGNKDFAATSLQISNIHAGTGATNVIPANVVIDFNFRFSPESHVESLQQTTEKLLQQQDLNFNIDWRIGGLPFHCQDEKFIAICQQAIKKVTGKHAELSTGGGTSDGRFVATTGANVIELGVINKTIHQIDECVKISDVETLADIYLQILTDFTKE